jgi:invasion protein IalB
MNRFASLVRCAAVALAVAAFGTAAVAQDQGAQQPRKPMTPTTMKTFAGWDVRCYPIQSPAPCDMWEAIAFKKGGQLAVSVSIVYVPSRGEHLLQFVVPLGTDLVKGAKVVTAGYTSEVWHYHHCDRIGCYIIVPQGNPVVNALKSQSKMKVEVVQFHGKAIDLDVPLKGFNDAHSALVELARQKTAGNNAAAPAQDEPAPSNP